MIDEQWDAFVIYVNAYYAVQEAYDSARRSWEKPADGLKEFCRDANPFLWDEKASAEQAIYDNFLQSFVSTFESDACSAEDGFSFARSWLLTQEGEQYGTSLVESFHSITNEREFARACAPVAKQLAARASRLERTPQDIPELVEAPAPKTPSDADIEAVISLLSHGDEEFANSLRARLQNTED